MRLAYIVKLAVISTAILVVGCLSGEEESTATEDSGNELTVLATTPMLGEFVKQVARENVQVEVLIPYATDPHHFEPSPQDVKKINEADLVFYVGLKYETAALSKLIQNSVESGQVLVEIGPKIDPIEFKMLHALIVRLNAIYFRIFRTRFCL